MKFNDSVDQYIREMRAEGRISSARTEVAYRACLAALADDVGNRDPRKVGREDVKRTLARWPNPNTGATPKRKKPQPRPGLPIERRVCDTDGVEAVAGSYRLRRARTSRRLAWKEPAAEDARMSMVTSLTWTRF